MHLFLIGPPRIGKSTLGKMAANILGVDFYDTDELLMQACKGKSIGQIQQTLGDILFRKKEQEFLFSLKERKDALVSTGGGIVLSLDNQQFLKETGVCLLLTLKKEILLKRLYDKPLSNVSLEKIEACLEERAPLYQMLADGMIPSSNNKKAVEVIKLFWESRYEKSLWQSFSDNHVR